MARLLTVPFSWILLLLFLPSAKAMPSPHPLAPAPDSMVYTDLQPCAYPFTLVEGKWEGAGADTLLRLAGESRFFLLGEYHGDADIAALTAALLPALKPMGYRHFAVETGPFSAHKLERLFRKGGPQAVVDFYRSQFSATGDIPIPFFDGHEDLVFLEAALENSYGLWGLDQEFLGGFSFLLEDLFAAAGSPEAHQAAMQALQRRVLAYYAANAADPETEVYDQLMADTAAQALMDMLAQRNADARARVQAIRATCRIYHNWKADRMANLSGRTEWMKRQFAGHWKARTAETQDPGRVLVKMGGMHLQKGFTGNACYELGNMLHELACLRGERSTHLGFAVRYYVDDDGSIGDNLSYNSAWIREMQPLLAQGRPDRWVLVDMRAARRLWINGRKRPGRALRDRIEGYDWILIPPAVRDTTPHYR